MGKNLLVVHGGAPTAVMNASLYGVLTEAKRHGEIDRVLAARAGTAGILKGDLIDLTDLPQAKIDLLPGTPATVIGTSRTPLRAEHYGQMCEAFVRSNVGYVLFNGGNGTMDACGKARAACETAGLDVRVVGIPKTIDNDIAVTDHAPGFGSAARYLAATVGEVVEDVRALPIHVCIVEAMGRNAGWLCAASALAGDAGQGPDMILLPEVPFEEEAFLARVEQLHARQGGVVVVASEGLRDPCGAPVVKPVFQIGRSVYFGDVGAHLAELVIRRLGVKARSEKPGICGRASIAHQSPVDREEAAACGREAVRLAAQGASGVMVTLSHTGELGKAAIEDVMLRERKLPGHFVSADGNGVTPAYLDWARPLIGGPLPAFLTL